MIPSPQVVFLVIFSISFAVAPPAAGFHDQGVAGCGGCHLLHDSDGAGFSGPQTAGLIAESASDVCLMCHAREAGAVLGADPLLPPAERGAGNFVFLLEDNINDAPAGGSNPVPGDAAGHNVVAPGHGLAADSRYAFSPGGSFPATSLGCTSCHDPHGNTAFRMLNGAVGVQDGAYLFSAPAPSAVGSDLNDPERPDNHSAYLEGVSQWCGNCHGRYHEEGLSAFEHPSDETLDADMRDRYNEYNGDADPTGGTQAFAYLPEVPLEDSASSSTSRRGATAGSRVICLTCHRAHASSAPTSGRWDFAVTLLVDDGRESGSWPLPSPYPNPDQGSLCRKCHQEAEESG